MPSCYAVGAEKALIQAALRARFLCGKGFIPKPSKSLFYCVTNPRQRSDEAMAVFRVEKSRGYTVMSNHHLRNKELSLKAKGLLSQMLSLPEDWDYTLAGLSHINRESIDAIRTAVWELEKAGYITRRQRQSNTPFTSSRSPRHWKTRCWKIQQRISRYWKIRQRKTRRRIIQRK